MNNQPSSAAFKVANIHAGEARHDLARQWMARPHDQRFLSLSDLQAHVGARAERCAELTSDNNKVRLIAPNPKTRSDFHIMTAELEDGTEIAPSHWAFGQIAGLAKAPAGYLRTLPSQIAADALNYGLRYSRGEEQVKLFHDGGTLLAANGISYGRIYDHEVVAAVRNVAGDGTGDTRWKVPGVMDWRSMVYEPKAPITKDTTTLYASDRDVFMFLVDDLHPIEVGKLPDGSPDLMFRGFYVTNSEVGAGAMRLAAFYLRAVCCNRIMWGVEGFHELTIRHTKYAPDRFIEMARPALESFADGSSAKLIDAVAKAKAAKIAETDEQAVAFLKDRGFSGKRATEIMEAVEREEKTPARSAWDIAQGITAVARDIPYQDDRFTMEGEAQRILEKVAA